MAKSPTASDGSRELAECCTNPDNHAERDVHRLLGSSYAAEPYELTLDLYDKEGIKGTDTVFALPPHELFAAVATTPRQFGLSILGSGWVQEASSLECAIAWCC